MAEHRLGNWYEWNGRVYVLSWFRVNGERYVCLTNVETGYPFTDPVRTNHVTQKVFEEVSAHRKFVHVEKE